MPSEPIPEDLKEIYASVSAWRGNPGSGANRVCYYIERIGAAEESNRALKLENERLKLLVREMGEAITSLLSDLPSKRDWLDPVLESRLWEAKSSYHKSQSEERR